MKALSPFERYRRTVAGEPVDFLPRIPILMEFAGRHIGAGYGAFASDYRVLTTANLRCVQDFGIDLLSTMSDPYRETSAFGAEVVFPPERVPYCIRPPLEADPDLTRLPCPDARRSPRTRNALRAITRYRELTGDEYPVLGWIEGPAAEAADLRGVGNFFVDLLEEPDYAVALMERCVDFAIEFARYQIEAGADTIGIGDAVCSQVSADVYQTLIWPREKRLVEALQSMGATVRLHICGNITHLLPCIGRLGVHILDVDHMVDLAAVRSVVGPSVVLTGNLDPVAEVMRGCPESIRAAVRRCFREAGPPYMVNAGCEIPPGTPDINLAALCEPLPCG